MTLSPQIEAWVSVQMITYNHERYIAQAIEGVVTQKTTFRIELVIGEDCSTDSTRKICEDYVKKYPEIIKLLPSEKNLGMNKNGLRTFQECNGKYIAICEGDDYWTDPYKLQKQVDFLEANDDFAICFHPVNIWLKGNLKADFLTRNVNDTTTISDLANGNYIHTPSVVFKNKLFGELPPEFSQSPVGDYFLHMLNARFGKIKKLPEVMAVYRLHESNTWANTNFTTMIPKWLKTLELMQPSFDDEIKQLLSTQYANIAFDLAIRLAAEKPMEAKLYLLKSVNANSLIVLNKITSISNTKDYKLGSFILRPLRFVKNLIRNFINHT